ncbi:MAG: OmpH family outer membrane protein [Deltaproteobacteria bacterium]|uniref:OmpH family outer membrane protein n=1 Tax=Candidatus Zymogenus saltonus TaxID=2844893 RepID=A0A9D8PM09_9DELT|nr:OmpH family outer membrane protein [Candidatus Zymogenus saltonus]
MKRISVLASLLVTFFVLIAFTVPVNAADVKIGVINVPKVIALSEPGKRAEKELTDKLKSVKANLDKELASYESMKKEFEKDALTLSDNVRAEKARKIQDKELKVKRMLQDYDLEFKKLRQELFKKILLDINAIVIQMGKDEGYTLILDSSTVLYFPDSIDLTNKVIKELNKK